MEYFEALSRLRKPAVFGRARAQDDEEHFRYLCPSRYFHFYLFFDRIGHRTCWLPEGFTV